MPTVPYARASLRAPLPLDIAISGINPDSDLSYRPKPFTFTKWDLFRFQQDYGTLQAVKRCGRAGHNCDGRECAACSETESNELEDRLRQLVARQAPQSVIVCTLTIKSSPSRSLSEALDDLAELGGYFTSGGWLSSRVDGYARTTEITFSEENGWHPHWHLLLVSRNAKSRPDAVKLAEEIRDRWLNGARRRLIAADARGVFAARVKPPRNGSQEALRAYERAVQRQVTYVAKDHLLLRSDEPGSSKRGDIIIAATAGDATAYERWLEIERATFGRTMYAAGGILRAPVNRSRSAQRRVVIFE